MTKKKDVLACHIGARVWRPCSYTHDCSDKKVIRTLDVQKLLFISCFRWLFRIGKDLYQRNFSKVPYKDDPLS